MCQPKSKGGKRCAAHHPGTLAVKFAIKNNTRLEQGQIDHAFKALRHIGKDQPDPTPEQYRQFLNGQKETIVNNGNLSESAKKRMVAKIDKALVDDQLPSGATYYALTHIEDRTGKSWRTLATKLREHAAAQGTSPATARRNFRLMYASTVTPRGGEIDYGNSLDPKTLDVLDKMRAGIEPKFEETPRITRTPMEGTVFASSGYDPEDGRLEVETTTGSLYAFHSVSPEDHERFQASPTAVFNELRISDEHQYEDKTEADQDAYRVWCEHCKEHKVASGHMCTNGNVAGAIIRHKKNADEIYKKVRDKFSDLHSVPDEAALVTPKWAVPVEDRPTHLMPEDSYTDTEGSHGRTVSGARRFVADAEQVITQLREGNKVEVHLGRKIAIAGTNQSEFYHVTVPVVLYSTHGEEYFTGTPNYRMAKCTCEDYQNNSRCKHIYPTEGSDQINRFLEQDVNRGIREIRDDQFNFRDARFGSRIFSFFPQGEEVRFGERNYRKLTPEQLSGIRYALTEDEFAQVQINNGGLGQNITIDIRPDGQMNVSGGRGVSEEAEQMFKAQVAEELESSNYTAARLARRAAQDMGEDAWEMQPESRTEYLRRFRSATTDGYLANTDEFVDDYKRAAADSGPLPFVAGPVTGGYLSTGPDEPNARGFGIEIEFDDADMEDIAYALHEAGLSEYNYAFEYHSGDGYDTWRVEEDGSVDGEIVSPILYDNEESWEQVRKVCDIAKRYGARASIQTGNHVHIGSHGFSTSQRQGVLAATAAHQDVVRRISTDPARGTHRTQGVNSYTAPFTEGDISRVYEMGNDPSYTIDRYRMANFGNDYTIEFRDADGTLDPGHIQAQVMLSSALMAAGESGEWENMSHTAVRRQRVGANSARQAYVNNAIEDEDERIIASNISLMTTLDSLFPDKESRKRMLAVAARIPWQSATRERY